MASRGATTRLPPTCCARRSSGLCRTTQPGSAYDICRGKDDPRRSRRDESCRACYAPAAQLDALVWRGLRELLTHPEHVAHRLARAHGGGWLPQERQARREQLRQDQPKRERQLERLTEAEAPMRRKRVSSGAYLLAVGEPRRWRLGTRNSPKRAGAKLAAGSRA